MSTLDSLKDPRSIASISALVAVGVSWTYFQGEISNLREDQEEIKEHLKTYIRANPGSNDQMDHLRQAIKVLDSRVNKQQEELQMFSEIGIPISEKAVSPPAPKTYKRLTKSATKHQKSRRYQPPLHIEDEDSDLDEDIAAMM